MRTAFISIIAIWTSLAGAGQATIESISDEYQKGLFERYPELGTNYGLPDARHDGLTDNSLDAMTEWQQREDRWLQQLNALGMPKDIGSRDWVSFGILHEELSNAVATRICRNELWSASTTTAWYTDLPSVFEIQPIETPDQRKQALVRLSAVAHYIDTEIANLKLGLKSGYSAPRVTVEAAPEGVRALLLDNTPFLSPGVRAKDTVFSQQVRELFDRQIAPAIERFADFLDREYLPKARTDIALTGNKNGGVCYPALVRSFATVGPAAEKIHQLGLEQIAGIRTEMQEIIDEHFPSETIESLMKNLNAKPEYTFTSRDEVLDYALASLDASKSAMSQAFGTLPKADMIIKPYPAYREASGSGEYHSSSVDGTRPGIYYIAVVDPTHRSRAGQQSVLYHEGYPGHHLQGAIALELGDRVHPLASYLWNSGFGEGWALYSERLAGELNLYSGPLDRIGLLSDQAARAARLVIDTGLHTMAWSREQSVAYMLANTAWPPVDVEYEINRYISWPGQANSYMLGMLEIRRLRTLAEERLGENFSLRAFHDRVLGSGSITLPMLEGSITAWIAEQTTALAQPAVKPTDDQS